MRPQADADADGQCLSRHLSASAPLRHLRTSLRTLRTFEMSARKAGGDVGSDSDRDDFSASEPSTRERKPAMAGTSKRGDWDDEIPF